ncbi:Nucleoporin-like protein 2 [Escovopsis weberi]|uniref:Nucleoporin-like protein 2 n=1 Tax=Escovopsis weberi TaxID=150374 RepID=A0A0M9VSK2_ESCWE|nr:Nucleoporin-like protein 2 [Escovopsis weberi]
MTVCRYFQQGNCKFGSTCRFEHPANANNRNQPPNRFGALGGPGGGGVVQDLLAKYHVSADTIEKDLTVDAPQWILSAYAPGRDVPEQLFGGYPREQSFEELRLHYWIGKASGNEQGALNEAQQLWQNAKQQMENAARNPHEAAQFMVEGENRHPNRHDICNEGTQGAPFGQFQIGRNPPSGAAAAAAGALGSGFPFASGAAPTSTGSAFGQPSAMGQRVNPFAQAAPAQSASPFGQPFQAQNASPFGQASQAQQNASPFGAPSQPQGQPAFGQPSQMGSAFGQASALGAKPSPFGAPAFGQASQPNAQGSPFGQTQGGSAFGQASQLGQKPNPFASAAASAATGSPFAQGPGNNAPAANPFASSGQQPSAAANPFASVTQTNAGSSPFGQAQQQQQQQPSQNAFGQPSHPVNVFTSSNQGPTPAASNPFAQQVQQQSPFGQQTDGASAFSSNTSSAANPFAQQQAPLQQQQQQQQPNGVGGAASGSSPYPPTSSRQHPPISSYTSKDMNGRLVRFKDQPVTYKDGQPGIRSFDGAWSKIWFPNGPPGYNKDTELPLDAYDEGMKAMWMQFAQTGQFANGVIPELPPPRECTQWDF